MESLLEYHGFLIKVFEEPYMVKEGPFLNSDKDYPTKCSKLVDLKKSGLIFEDVSPPTQVISPSKAPKETQMTKTTDKELKSFPSVQNQRSLHSTPSVEVFSPVHALDEEMEEFEVVPSPKEPQKMQPIAEIPIFHQQRKDENQLPGLNPLSWEFSLPKPLPSIVSNAEKPNFDVSFSSPPQRSMHSDRKETPLQLVSKTTLQDRLPDVPYECTVENPVPHDTVNALEDEETLDVLLENENEDVMVNYEDEEIAEAKLKLILRFSICFTSLVPQTPQLTTMTLLLVHDLLFLHFSCSGHGRDVLQGRGSCERKGSLLQMLHWIRYHWGRCFNRKKM